MGFGFSFFFKYSMRNYQVFVNGEAVDLVPGVGFDLEMSNPMFEFSSISGSKAMEIRALASSKKNRLLFGNVGSPMVRKAKTKYYCEQVLNGNVIDIGYCTIRMTVNEYILDFTSDLSDLFTGVQNELLPTLNFTPLAIPGNWNTTITNTWSSGGYVLPMIKNEIFYDANAPGGWDGVVNKYASSAYVWADKNPMFYLKKIINDVAVMGGVSMSGPWWSSALANALLIYNTRIADAVNIDTRLYLPELTIGQLLMNIRKLYNVVLWMDGVGKSIKIESESDILNKDVSLDWTRKTMVKFGTPYIYSGVRLASASLGQMDGLGTDAYYEPYVLGEQTKTFGIETALTGIQVLSGMPTVKQAGITPTQADKKFAPRLLYYTGNAIASDAFGGVKLKWNDNDGLANNYWKSGIALRNNAWETSALVDLNAADVAKVSNIFKGKDAAAPMVHIGGVNYIIKKLTVPSDGALSRLDLVRI